MDHTSYDCWPHPGLQSLFLVNRTWPQHWIKGCRTVCAVAAELLDLLLRDMDDASGMALRVVKHCKDGIAVMRWLRSMADTFITRRWPSQFWASMCHLAKSHTAEQHGMSIGKECRPPCLALLGHCLQMLLLVGSQGSTPESF